ncbi:MAG: pentapeptide repeat-containing protein [Magnetococcales bacterium]|nr:pentapeptide repeat-containing protein [Magnetococcales bacterium]
MRIYLFPIGRWLVGDHKGLVSVFLATYVVITCMIFPLVVLFAAELRFVAYHDAGITRIHGVMVVTEIILIWYFWPKITSDHVLSLERQYTGQRGDGKFDFVIHVTAMALGVGVFPEGTLMLLQEATAKKDSFLNCLVVRGEILVKDPPTQELIAAYVAGNKHPDQVWLDHSQGLDLSGRDLHCADFSGSRFFNVKFGDGINLSGAIFRSGYLNFAQLKNANLESSDLSGAELVDVNLEGALLHNTILNKVNLTGSNLIETKMDNVKLFSSNLILTILYDSEIKNTNFRFANLNYSQIDEIMLKDGDNKFANVLLTGVIVKTNNNLKYHKSKSDFLEQFYSELLYSHRVCQSFIVMERLLIDVMLSYRARVLELKVDRSFEKMLIGLSEDVWLEFVKK